MPHIPTIAILGRANVGKSTLFNRLVEARQAMVSPIAGTTRDRQEGVCLWRGRVIRVVDTGGLDIKHPDDIEEEIVRQAKIAAKEADIVILLGDGSVGLTGFDRQLADELLQGRQTVLGIANKEDTKEAKRRAYEAWHWALGAPRTISAARGTGIGDLLDEIYDLLEKRGKPPIDIIETKPTRVVVLGKPNVGKSTLLNRVLGEERFITSPVAHTTREPNDVLVERNGHEYVFIDTAGIRKKSQVRRGDALERESVARARIARARADVILFVIEPNTFIEVQERTLAGEVGAASGGAIVVVNKWDTVPEKKTNTVKEFEAFIRDGLPPLRHAPMVFVSALKGQRTEKLFEMIDKVEQNRYTQLSDDVLAEFLQKAMHRHKPVKGMGSAPPKILGLRQVGVAPPTFELALKARRVRKLHPSYLRYLENRLRETFDLAGTPVRIYVKTVSSSAT